jgi:hypothetical protein
MRRTEITPNGLATYHEPTFRTYAPETRTNAQGETITIQLCEEWLGGRWEGFVSVLTPQSLRRSHIRRHRP